MLKKYLPLLAIALVLFIFLPLSYSEVKDSIPPKVISTTPQNGAKNVDPKLTKISVTFTEPMRDKSWSWSYENKNDFPQLTGQPYYNKDFTKCILPVKLKSNKNYIIWINTAKFKSFKNQAGNSAEPYKLTFKTK